MNTAAKACVLLAVTQRLPNHFCSVEIALFRIPELSPSVRRLLTAILPPGFNTSPQCDKRKGHALPMWDGCRELSLCTVVWDRKNDRAR